MCELRTSDLAFRSEPTWDLLRDEWIPDISLPLSLSPSLSIPLHHPLSLPLSFSLSLSPSQFAEKFAEYKEAARLAKEKSQEKMELATSPSQVCGARSVPAPPLHRSLYTALCNTTHSNTVHYPLNSHSPSHEQMREALGTSENRGGRQSVAWQQTAARCHLQRVEKTERSGPETIALSDAKLRAQFKLHLPLYIEHHSKLITASSSSSNVH